MVKTVAHLAPFALFLFAAHALPATARTPDENAVMQADEGYRLAKLQHDLPALARLLSDDFSETNQNGSTRDKQQMIELWKTFRIDSLVTNSFVVQVTGDFAVVRGTQTEDRDGRTLFSRTYRREGGAWQLFASTQFDNPNPRDAGMAGLFASGVQQVAMVDEAYRLAKLRQDLSVLSTILAGGFSETNQNGNTRDKAETLALWKRFSISSLTTDSMDVRVAGELARVTGRQTEDGSEHMLFTRVYIQAKGEWQLLSSIQFRDPDFQRISYLRVR